MEIKDAVVVVTGATSGVGRATAREFGRRGAKVGLIAREPQALKDARAEIESRGAEALDVPTDVADADQVEAAAEAIESELGPIDIWVNNAMVSVFSPVKEMTPDEYKRVTDVTYIGYVYGTLAAMKRMLPRDRGAIVQVGSALAYRGIPLQSAYCASKHAIQGFVDSLRSELMHDRSNVKVTMVQMPALNTPQFNVVKSRLPNKPQPVPPIYQPEVAARAIAWAATHDRKEIQVGASTIATVMAEKFISPLLDRYLARTGYKSQQRNEADDPSRPNNLWESIPHDFGAHGDFDARASDRSYALWASMHKRSLVAAGAAAAAVAALARRH